MAFTAVPAWIEAGNNESNTMRQMLNTLVAYPGLGSFSDFPVTQTSTPSMAVQVGAGRVFIRGSQANVSGFNFNTQGMYFGLNDAPVTLTIAAANATNPRIDIVCATVNDASYSGSLNSGVLQVVTGTPNATPVAPATPANSYVLAQVTVPANATSIVNSNINTAVAVPYDYLHVEMSGPTLSGVTNGAKTNFGTLAFDTANSFNYYLPGTTTPSWIQPYGTNTGQFQVLQDGNYLITARYGFAVSDPGGLALGMDFAGSRSLSAQFAVSRPSTYIDQHLSTSGNIRLQANDIVTGWFYAANGPNCKCSFFVDKLS